MMSARNATQHAPFPGFVKAAGWISFKDPIFFFKDPIFDCINEKLPNSRVDHPQLIKFSMFGHVRGFQNLQIGIISRLV